MLTALATIFGALAGLVPTLLQFMTMRTTNAYNLELKRLELAAAEKGYTFQLDLAAANADIHQQDHIYNFANAPSGIKWVDALAVLVRPYITLITFNFWWLLKLAVFVAAVNAALVLDQIVPLVWTEADTAMLGAIVGFWFGNRSGVRAMVSGTATVTTTTSVKPSAKSPIFIPAQAGDRP